MRYLRLPVFGSGEQQDVSPTPLADPDCSREGLSRETSPPDFREGPHHFLAHLRNHDCAPGSAAP